jgi:hypothetical protein
MSIEKSNDPIGTRTRVLPACGIVPQPITPPRAHKQRFTVSFYSLLVAVKFREPALVFEGCLLCEANTSELALQLQTEEATNGFVKKCSPNVKTSSFYLNLTIFDIDFNC